MPEFGTDAVLLVPREQRMEPLLELTAPHAVGKFADGAWQRVFERSGMAGLRTTRVQEYRDTYERWNKW